MEVAVNNQLSDILNLGSLCLSNWNTAKWLHAIYTSTTDGIFNVTSWLQEVNNTSFVGEKHLSMFTLELQWDWTL